MTGDGGYAKAWRNYVNTAHATGARVIERKIASDLVNLQHQINLDEEMSEAVGAAAKAVRHYLSSIRGVTGDPKHKDAALTLIDEMESALRDAVGRYD